MDYEDEYDESDVEEAQRAEELVDSIIERCEAAKIEFDDFCEREEFGVVDVNLDIQLPSGRKKREVNLWDVSDLEAFAAVEFEKYTIIGNFAAIACYEKGEIEAAFGLLDEVPLGSPVIRKRLLSYLGLTFKADKTIEPLELTADVAGHNVQLSLCELSPEIRVLTGAPRAIPVGLKIKHPKFSTHADALRILEKIAHSFFFEVEAESGIGLTLLRKRDRRISTLTPRKDVSLEFPKYEYDDGPMSLYWYARSARNMPLLQFLAFYQAIEFYFPAFFNAEISRRIRAIIKDPAFRVDREADLAKVVGAARPRGAPGGSEKDQLRATLRECVSDDDVLAFLKKDKSRMEFFGSKQKGLTACTLNPKNKGEPLVQQVADRVYDIRCKVVHVKADEGDAEVELLLPYTEEAEKLDQDIELVRMLARKVLVCSSSAMRLS